MSRDDPSGYHATIFDPTDPDDLRSLETLRADPAVVFLDRAGSQASTLAALRPLPDAELLDEPMRWAYFPWRRTAVAILGPNGFRRVRFDRNRNLITTEEQRQLAKQRVAIVGLSVGHAIAHTLAAQGLCGELRLADFDDVDLSNLNRTPATLFDIGENKAVTAARRIAEVDPYLTVTVLADGLTAESVEDFLDGMDVVVEECDSLDMKCIVREKARAKRQPVLMATSHRGLVDVERFDLEPRRPIFHGLLGDIDTGSLGGLTSREKVPHVLRIVDAAGLSARGAASLIEVGHTLTTWPQLAGEVMLAASVVAEAVRRIGLGEELPSGRGRIDVAAVLDRLTDPTSRPHSEPTPGRGAPDRQGEHKPTDVADVVAAAAARAPSGGNAQPWHIEAAPDEVVINLAPRHKSVMDIGLRGSAVAFGAAVFNARVAAAAEGVLGEFEITQPDGPSSLRATVALTGSGDPDLATLYHAMAQRETNRRRGSATAIPAETVEALEAAAAREGARLALLTGSEDLRRAGTLLAAADRIRYLTPQLHADMVSELRWPGDDSPQSGIDVRSLELDPGELLTLDVLRRPEVMSLLAEWNAGAALGADTLSRVQGSSALALVTVSGDSLIDHAQGGSAAEAVWITAQHRGLAVQPLSPVFLYAHGDDELSQLSPTFATTLRDLQAQFHRLAHITDDETLVLVLRLHESPPTSVRSRRRGIRSGPPPLR